MRNKRADGGSRTEAVRAVAHDDGRDVVLLVGENPAYFTWWFTKRIATNPSTRKKTTKPARMPIDWDKQRELLLACENCERSVSQCSLCVTNRPQEVLIEAEGVVEVLADGLRRPIRDGDLLRALAELRGVQRLEGPRQGVDVRDPPPIPRLIWPRQDEPEEERPGADGARAHDHRRGRVRGQVRCHLPEAHEHAHIEEDHQDVDEEGRRLKTRAEADVSTVNARTSASRSAQVTLGRSI